jgi:hypothetical protein
LITFPFMQSFPASPHFIPPRFKFSPFSTIFSKILIWFFPWLTDWLIRTTFSLIELHGHSCLAYFKRLFT